MNAYLIVSGGLFGLVGIAHGVRLFVEGGHAGDHAFIAENLLLVLVGCGLATWALTLLRRARRGPR